MWKNQEDTLSIYKPQQLTEFKNDANIFNITKQLPLQQQLTYQSLK